MANSNCLEGMRCPKCGFDEHFKIVVTGIAHMTDDGYDYVQEGEWDGDSPCWCGQCGHDGLVKDFDEGKQQ